jgi:hypothetical protein
MPHYGLFDTSYFDSEKAFVRMDHLFNSEFPTKEYPTSKKNMRMEDIAAAFFKDHGCDCSISEEECLAVVERYSNIYARKKYQQADLQTYIANNQGVSNPKGTMDELRRVAMTGPSVQVDFLSYHVGVRELV